MKRENAAKKYYKKNLIIFIAVFVPLTLLFSFFPIVFARETVEYTVYWSFPIIVAAISFPFIIYYLVQFIHYSNTMFVDIQTATIYDCDTINRGRYGTFIGFYVKVVEDGYRTTVVTKHVHNKADGYLGATVEVGRDATRGEWIVLE